jgi:hypothetical protein
MKPRYHIEFRTSDYDKMTRAWVLLPCSSLGMSDETGKPMSGSVWTCVAVSKHPRPLKAALAVLGVEMKTSKAKEGVAA